MQEKLWDIFISHASEDKQSIVKDLANEFNNFGVKIWYDEFTLKIGDSLSRSIDKGLANSNYGLVILSPAFLSKDWTEYELKGLTALELGRDKVILPIWHNITRNEILRYSPILADKFALSTKDKDYKELAIEIIKIIRPDIFERYIRKLAYENTLKEAEIKLIDIKEIRTPPIIHEKLPDELIIRIRLIRASLLSITPHSMEFWIDGFKRDTHPTKEVSWWEFLSTCYLEYIQMGTLSSDQYKSAYNILFYILNMNLDEDTLRDSLRKDIEIVTDDGFQSLCNLVNYLEPYYDMEEELPTCTRDLSNFNIKEHKKRYDADNFEN